MDSQVGTHSALTSLASEELGSHSHVEEIGQVAEGVGDGARKLIVGKDAEAKMEADMQEGKQAQRVTDMQFGRARNMEVGRLNGMYVHVKLVTKLKERAD